MLPDVTDVCSVSERKFNRKPSQVSEFHKAGTRPTLE